MQEFAHPTAGVREAPRHEIAGWSSLGIGQPYGDLTTAAMVVEFDCCGMGDGSADAGWGFDAVERRPLRLSDNLAGAISC